MPKPPRHFVVVDPRTADGDPFEVADRAVSQLKALVELSLDSFEAARLMARNAELERQCQRDEELDASGWDDTVEGRRWAEVYASLEGTARQLETLRRVALFNPRNPPKA